MFSQVPVTTEQQLEDLTNATESEIEDDSYLQQLNYFKEHPLNLNEATAEDLQIFKFLTDLQIQNLLQYRKLLGMFIDVYELQAIPTWSLITIKRIIPFVTITSSVTFHEEFIKRLSGGTHSFIIRNTRILEKSRGYDTSLATHYLGNRDHLFVRFIYQYKNLLQYGIVADKDAGEQFFKGRQKQGFDFYSFHFLHASSAL